MFQHLTLYILGLQRNNVCSLPLYVNATTSTELSKTTPRHVTLNWSTWTTMLLDQTGISSSTHVQWQLL